MADRGDDAVLAGTFAKLDAERKLAFGWAYVSKIGGQTVVDHSGDFIDDQAFGALEDAAYNFVLESRQADEAHERFEGVGQIVESVVLTKEKLEAMGLTGDRIGWWVGFRIEDDGGWGKVKDGTYSAFSIRGTGERSDAEAP